MSTSHPTPHELAHGHVVLPDGTGELRAVTYGRRRGDLHLVPPGLVLPEEGPAEHLRNALAILRFSIDHDPPLIGNGCPAVAVPITSLARMQARLECAIEQLDRTPPLVAP